MPKAKAAAATVFSFGEIAPTTVKSRAKAATTAKTIAIAGLRDLKACQRLRAVITGVEKQIETEAKIAMAKYYVATGCESKMRPENFTGIDQGQEANCQLRARSFGPYGVDEDVAADLVAADLGEVIEESVTLEFNPEVIADETVRKAVEKALSSIPNLPPNIIVKKVKRTLNAKAIEHVFANMHHDPALVDQVLPLVSTLAIRCDYSKTADDLQDDVQRVATLLQDATFADIVKEAAANPEKMLNPRSKPAKKKAA